MMRLTLKCQAKSGSLYCDADIVRLEDFSEKGGSPIDAVEKGGAAPTSLQAGFANWMYHQGFVGSQSQPAPSRLPVCVFQRLL